MTIVMTNSQLPEMLQEDKDYLLTAGSKISAKDIYRYQVGIPLVRNKYYKYQDVEKVFSVINGTLVEVSEHAHRTEKLLLQTRKESADKDAQIEDLKQQVNFVLEQNNKLADHLDDINQHVINQPNIEEVTQDYEKKLQEYEDGAKVQEEAYSRLADSSVEKIKDLEDGISNLVDSLDQANQEVVVLNLRLDNQNDELEEAYLEIERLKAELQASNENQAFENEFKTLLEEKETLENTIKEQKTLIGGLTSDVNMLSYKLDKVTELSKTRIETLEKEIMDIKGV